MHHHEHFSLYCINIEQKRIDILDSINYKAINTLFSDHHDKVLMDCLMKRLSDAFQKISKHFPNFSTWRRVQFKHAPVMKQKNDCTAVTMFYLEHYDGMSKKLIRVRSIKAVTIEKLDPIIYFKLISILNFDIADPIHFPRSYHSSGQVNRAALWDVALHDIL